MDPNGDDIYYVVDWGDDTYSWWLGPYSSGKIVTAKHLWKKPGDYEVRVKARDDNSSSETEWSDPYVFNVEDGPFLEFGKFSSGFLKMKVELKNTGGIDAEDIKWSIESKEGLVFIGAESSGKISELSHGKNVVISSNMIFGVGQATFKIKAEISNGPSISKTVNAFLVPFFVMVYSS